MKPKLYLFGPITGLTYEGCSSWREYVAGQLPEYDCIDPLRGCIIKDDKAIMTATYTGNNNWKKQTLASSKAIMAQSRWDVKRADLLLGTLQGSTRVSIGSCFELAWASDQQIPVICAMALEFYDHPMINESVTHPVETLKQGVEIAKALL
jgi:hypothetical protein